MSCSAVLFNIRVIPFFITGTLKFSNNPAGWSTDWTALNIGSPPEDQYLWELILEVGQRALKRYVRR